MKHVLKKAWDAYAAFPYRPLILPLLYLLGGVFLLIFPFGALRVLAILLGGLLLIYTIARCMLLFTNHRNSPLFYLHVFLCCLCFVVGSSLLFNPDGALSFARIGIGFLLVVDALYRLVHICLCRVGGAALRWGLSVACLCLLFGAVLLFFPAVATRTLTVILAVALFYEAGVGVLFFFLEGGRHAPLRTERKRTHHEDYIEAEFTDKTDSDS